MEPASICHFTPLYLPVMIFPLREIIPATLVPINFLMRTSLPFGRGSSSIVTGYSKEHPVGERTDAPPKLLPAQKKTFPDFSENVKTKIEIFKHCLKIFEGGDCLPALGPWDPGFI